MHVGWGYTQLVAKHRPQQQYEAHRRNPTLEYHIYHELAVANRQLQITRALEGTRIQWNECTLHVLYIREHSLSMHILLPVLRSATRGAEHTSQVHSLKSSFSPVRPRINAQSWSINPSPVVGRSLLAGACAFGFFFPALAEESDGCTFPLGFFPTRSGFEGDSTGSHCRPCRLRFRPVTLRCCA